MTNHIAYAHISAVPAIFCRYISVIYVKRCVVCICNKVEYRQGAELKQFYDRSYIVNSSDLCNTIKKILDKISRHRQFKL